MNSADPLTRSKSDLKGIIDKISSESSAVGIDAQYTHAVIIEYLKDISNRLKKIEGAIQMSSLRKQGSNE